MLLLGAGLAVAPATVTSAGAATSGTRAPALYGAARGGDVIVWLRDQHADLDLRTQGDQRTAQAHADQAPLVAEIKAAGGTHIVQLVSVNAIAAHLSAAEVSALQQEPGVLQIVPDDEVTIGDRAPTGPTLQGATITPDPLGRARHPGRRDANAFPSDQCGTMDHPLVEPEALGDIHAPAMTNAGLASEPGHGVIVANDGLSSPPSFSLVGNPNFVRPAADGGGSVVVDAQPGDVSDKTDGEYYGDASSIAAQGTVEYQYSQELPYAGLPSTCYFTLVGDAPGASLLDTENVDTPESIDTDGNPATRSDAQFVAGIDAAVISMHADVINESYGYSNTPGSYAVHYAANDAAIDAGVTVVVSSGDSGPQGTVSSPATDPSVIAVGATNTLRLNSMAYGFSGWVNGDVTPLSSGGPSPENRLVDLVAPGYGGEAACNPAGSDCPTNTQTEAFGGTSESAPLVAGAAADVIAVYRDSHNGESPSPALVKRLLTGTATDVGAPADQQGAGLVDITAAMDAAKATTNSTTTTYPTTLLPTPTQLDVTGAGGTTAARSLSLYNAGPSSTTVTATYRSLGPEQPIGAPVTESVSAPDPSAPVPADGAQAAPDVHFSVPAGLDRLDATMIWPDSTNSAILDFVLVDPEGRLRDLSYDYGSGTRVPNLQRAEIADPESGTWTAEIKWGNGRSHLQEPPNVPGSYTGTVSFRVGGQTWQTEQASPAVTIGAHRSGLVPLTVALPSAPGDHPQSVQLTADNGATLSVPIARRTLVPSTGGEFDTAITNTVGRGIGELRTFDVVVPPGQHDLGITLATPDTSADDPMTVFLVNPNGTSVATHTSNGHTANGLPLTVQDVHGVPMQTATYHVTNPAAGTWEIDTELNLTTSGREFDQTIVGDVLPQAPVIGSPADGAGAGSATPVVSGSGTPGDTVTVTDGTHTIGTARVGPAGTWSTTTTPLPAGSVTMTATQADATGFPSLASAAVTVTVPAVAAKASSSTTVEVNKRKVKAGRSVKVTVHVTSAAGSPGPTGPVTLVIRTGKRTQHVTAALEADGTATVKVRLKHRGRSHLTAGYAGDDHHLASTSPSVTVKVR